MLPKQPMFTTLPTHLVLFVFIVYSFGLSSQQVCNHQDHYALLAFSADVLKPPSLPLNWSFHVNCCRWEGIKCDVNGRVTHLQLPSRGLNGVISSSITTIKMLRLVDLSSNSIFGSIPRDIGNLFHLKTLNLNENSFSGHIPPSLMNCTHLVEIFLRSNYLSGDISKLDFSKLVRLQKLDLRNNTLSGIFPKSIYACRSLIAIRVALNNITGQISPKVNELKSLSFLSLGFNSFTNITMTLRVLAKCKNLTFLSFSSNFNGETLPVDKTFIGLNEYQKLQVFTLEHCNFEAGPIPNWLSNLKSLRILHLSGIRLTGRIPNWLGTLPNLFAIVLSDNSLFGEIPLTISQVPALISEHAQANLDFSQFELPLFFEYGGNRRLSVLYKADFPCKLDLSNNSFNGNIPKEIGNLYNLQHLLLQNNQFSGHIPYNISKLKNLEILDLSSNNLTGEIPTSLSILNFLSYFNVSYNNLKGLIPSSVQFSTFEESSFVGNPALCGKPSNHTCNKPTASQAIFGNRRHDNEIQKFRDGLYVGFASGFFSILIIVVSYAWINYRKTCQISSRRGHDLFDN